MPTESVWIPNDPVAAWTMVLALATIALVVVAAFGLRSLVLAKREMRTRAERESALRAMERCEAFATSFIPRNQAILDTLAEHKIPVFVESSEKIQFDEVDEKELERAWVWLGTLPGALRDKILMALNDLEAWAGYFVNRIADEKVAFGPCAPPFCSFVTQSYALLIIVRSLPHSGDFPNVVKLFLSWQERLAMPEVLARLEELQSRTKFSHELGRPIGMED